MEYFHKLNIASKAYLQKYFDYNRFVVTVSAATFVGIFVAMFFLSPFTSWISVSFPLDTPVNWLNATPNLLLYLLPIASVFFAYRSNIKNGQNYRLAKIRELEHKLSELSANGNWREQLFEFRRLYENIYSCQRPHYNDMHHIIIPTANYVTADINLNDMGDALEQSLLHLKHAQDSEYEQEYPKQRIRRIHITRALDDPRQLLKSSNNYRHIESQIVSHVNTSLNLAEIHFVCDLDISSKYLVEIDNLKERNSATS